MKYSTLRKRRAWRRLVFGGEAFQWRVIHEHHVVEGPFEGKCREVLVAKLEAQRGCTLRLEFSDGPGRLAGYPQAGVVWLTAPGAGPRASANLNLPRMARAAIEVSLESGWEPRGARHLTCLDGWSLLDALIVRYERLGGGDL
jgi:hypothetical protein